MSQAAAPLQQANCPLCQSLGGDLVYRNSRFRVIDALDADYPGFLRLVWNDHVREFSQLQRDDRLLCMDAVAHLEQFVLNTFKADKANLATLGNVVPHLHWHVIPRFVDDKHFPAPVWAAAKPGVGLVPKQQAILDTRSTWLPALRADLVRAFGT
ncbi:HIT family protein [Limnobacter sp.]|uniref:HIT family protein n=1 Tax=Limnobacter sp. TaxID=2003368 RepID=UPI0035157AA9